jgi:putative toxin-antitoxin system antitoxin component (TIGR02293 family)
MEEASMGFPATAADVLGGSGVLKGAADSTEAMMELLRTGLPIEALEVATQTLGLSSEEVSTVLGIPKRTLARRRKEHQLSPYESNRLFRLAHLAAHALDVFDDREQAQGWFHEPIPALGGRTPVSMLDTEAGVVLVDDELGRIEHGIFA